MGCWHGYTDWLNCQACREIAKHPQECRCAPCENGALRQRLGDAESSLTFYKLQFAKAMKVATEANAVVKILEEEVDFGAITLTPTMRATLEKYVEFRERNMPITP